MLKENSVLLTNFHKALDIIFVIISFIVAYHLKRNLAFPSMSGLDVGPNYYLVLLVIVILAPCVFNLTGCYTSYRIQNFNQIAMRYIRAVIGVLGGTVIALYLLHQQNVSRLLLILFGSILITILLLNKALVYYTLRYYRSRQYNTRNVLIIGTGRRATRMINALKKDQEDGYQVIGCLDPINPEPYTTGKTVGCVKILGHLSLLPDMLLKDIVDEVIFAADLGGIPSVIEYIECAEELGISIHIVPDFQLEEIMYQPEAATVFMENFAGLPTMAITTTPQRHTELLVKALMDYIGAASGLIMLAPFFLIIAVAIKLTSDGPIFFLQERSGVYGRIFPLIKFRTMVENAEELKKELEQDNEVSGPVFKVTNDPRITPIGRFLRKTSLDELPQLINVLRGEMSLVGPRPPIPSEVAQYQSWQRRRLSMKPGLTCIWQVSGRNNIDFERWMRMDLEYIDNWSLLLDIKILCKTVVEVLCCRGK
ncbi:MAG: sugar transferase [Candidatus Electrothrix gigas]